jgi:hypothetical protein
MAEKDALSDTDKPITVKKDSPGSPSWQKRYDSEIS